jgi:hypothetical protein
MHKIHFRRQLVKATQTISANNLDSRIMARKMQEEREFWSKYRQKICQRTRFSTNLQSSMLSRHEIATKITIVQIANVRCGVKTVQRKRRLIVALNIVHSKLIIGSGVRISIEIFDALV